MSWFVLFLGVPLAWISWRILRWLFPPTLYAVPWRWRLQSWSMTIPDHRLPMNLALEQRDLLADLLQEGYGVNARTLLREADQIIATVSTIQRAMSRMGFGYTAALSNGQSEWRPNPSAAFRDLEADAANANEQLTSLYTRLRGILNVGVRVSSATAQLVLDEHIKDSTIEADALDETRNL